MNNNGESNSFRDLAGTMKITHLLLGAGLALSFCLPNSAVRAAENAKTAVAVKDEAKKTTRPTVSIGMSAAEVRELIGQPAQVKPYKKGEVRAEIWCYSYDQSTGVRLVSTGMRDVPFYNFRIGAMDTYKEPIYGQERLVLVETTELLMVDGVLASAKRYREQQRNYE